MYCVSHELCSRFAFALFMLTPSNGNIRFTGPLCGEFTGFPAQRPMMRIFDIFFDLRINGGVNNREAGYLRRHRAHYDVIVMFVVICYWSLSPIPFRVISLAHMQAQNNFSEIWINIQLNYKKMNVKMFKMTTSMCWVYFRCSFIVMFHIYISYYGYLWYIDSHSYHTRTLLNYFL